MSNLATSTPTGESFPINELLASFAGTHGRGQSPRTRRTLDELLGYLGEYFEDNSVVVVAKRGRVGVVSLSGALAWLDAFEQNEMFDALDGEREKLRVADTAMRALTRYLKRALG